MSIEYATSLFIRKINQEKEEAGKSREEIVRVGD